MARMRMTLPSIDISWISTVVAAVLCAETSVAPWALRSCMKTPPVFWPGAVARVHASFTSIPCAAATAGRRAAAAMRSTVRREGAERMGTSASGRAGD
jgi:hypothetical protein